MLEDMVLKREQFPVWKDGKRISLKQIQIPPYNPHLMAQWHFSRESLAKSMAEAFRDYLNDLREIQLACPQAAFYLDQYSNAAILPVISQSGREFICSGIPGLGELKVTKLKIDLRSQASATIPNEEVTSTYVVPQAYGFNESQKGLYRLKEQKAFDSKMVFTSSLGWAVQGSGIIQKIFLKSMILALDNLALDFNKADYSQNS